MTFNHNSFLLNQSQGFSFPSNHHHHKFTEDPNHRDDLDDLALFDIDLHQVGKEHLMELSNHKFHFPPPHHRNSNFLTSSSRRSSLSDLNSFIPEQVHPHPNPLLLLLLLLPGHHPSLNPISTSNFTMGHRHSFSISSEQSAIETNPQDGSTRNLSIPNSDSNISPVLKNDPFELDQSVWSAAPASISTANPYSADDPATTPSYMYRQESSLDTSPTFNGGMPKPFQGDAQPVDGGNFNSRRTSNFSDIIWNQDPQQLVQQQQQPFLPFHSRHASFNNAEWNSQYGALSSNSSSPVWAQVSDWKQKMPPQQLPFIPMNNDDAIAAQRRHSYAAVGDKLWSQDNYPNLSADGGYFNYSQQPQMIPPPFLNQPPNLSQQQQLFGSNYNGQVQKLSADLSTLGISTGDNDTSLGFTSDLSQVCESTEAMRSAYKSVDYYFTNDEFGRVHITDTSTAELPAALEALSKKGAQLPRFPITTSSNAKLVLVAFKAGRVDVFSLPETSSLILTVGDLVFVEADRGHDLGKVVRLNVTIDEARLLKLRQHQEQQLALADNEQLSGSTLSQQQQQQQQAMPSLHFPKPIIKFADPQQILQVANKQADEEKSRRVCALKVRAHGLVMQVVDLEYQWDRRKLIFYYAANQRIDFRELVKELFRIYRTRIWMCAVSGGLSATQQQQIQQQSSQDLGFDYKFNPDNSMMENGSSNDLNHQNRSGNN